MVQVFIAIAAQNIPSTDVDEFAIDICLDFCGAFGLLSLPIFEERECPKIEDDFLKY